MLLLIIILIITNLILSLFGPWWFFGVGTFLVAVLWPKDVKAPFWSGFLSIFVFWLVTSLFKSVPNNHLLANKMAKVLFLPNWFTLLIVTSVIGGTLGGLSLFTGNLIRDIFKSYK